MSSLRPIEVTTDGAPMRKASKSSRPLPADRGPASEQLLLLVATHERVFPVVVSTDSELIVGRGPNADVRLSDPNVAPRHLAMRAMPNGTLEVEDLKSRTGTLLNDVQLSSKSQARIGDQISIGDSALLVLRTLRPLKRRVKIVQAAELDERLSAESERARRFRRAYSLLLLRCSTFGLTGSEELVESLSLLADPACTWGRFGPLVRALLCPEMTGEELAGLRGRVAAALGAEGHRFSIGYASFPADGADADCILERALIRLSGQDPAPPGSTDESLFLDSVMVRLLALVEKLARGDSPVLFQGERGSGKETLARILHQRSGRSAGPFAHVAGTALVPPALEAELFGQENGAAPHAEARFGALETAAGGTVFIEEIGALPPATQAKLAQALEGRSAARVGSNQTYKVDVRIAAATEEDLAALVREGKLREDLFGRLSAQTVLVPPLRDRPSEIVPMSELFLARCRRVHGRPRLTLSSEGRAALLRYAWPGNVRELKNAIERAAMISETDEIRLDALPPTLAREVESGDPAALAGRVDLRSSMRVAERDAFLKTLAVTRWNVTETAKRLGLPRRTVIYRMSRLGLRRPGR